MSIETKIKLLWNCATTLEGDGHVQKLLKSHYMNTCRNLARNSVQIPKEKFAISQMCPYCGRFWRESELSLKLKPQHVAISSKTNKLIEKLDKSKDPANKSKLTKKQKNRAKWVKKRVSNYMEITCHQCKRKSLVKMEKPKKEKDEKIKIVEICNINENENRTNTVKKKKKSKSKTAGLKIPPKNAEDTKKLLENAKTKPASISTTKQMGQPLTKNHSCQINERQTHQNQTSKLKAKKKSKGAVSSTTEPTANKVISKTQKQNSLLQLAALLKTQSHSTGAKSSAQKRLESLLN